MIDEKSLWPDLENHTLTGTKASDSDEIIPDQVQNPHTPPQTVWLASCELRAYSNQLEPTLHPHLFTALVRKSAYDKATEELAHVKTLLMDWRLKKVYAERDSLAKELKIQDQANEILTEMVSELKAGLKESHAQFYEMQTLANTSYANGLKQGISEREQELAKKIAVLEEEVHVVHRMHQANITDRNAERKQLAAAQTENKALSERFVSKTEYDALEAAETCQRTLATNLQIQLATARDEVTQSLELIGELVKFKNEAVERALTMKAEIDRLKEFERLYKELWELVYHQSQLSPEWSK